jgi:hypothetical protein
MLSADAAADLLFNQDDLRPVAVLAHERTGRRPSPSTIWRWVREGTRAGQLPAVKVFGTWHTTPEAFADFLRRRTAPIRRSQSASEQAPEVVDVTDQQLRAMGLL